MKKRGEVLAALSALGIAYELTEHEAVFTIDEVKELGLLEMGTICKNLFLRDAKGKNHYLVVMAPEKQANLRGIGEQLGSTKLGFASENRLQTILGLEKGAVTPLGVVNDSSHAVTVVFDSDLRGNERLGVHPNDNAATVWLSFDSLEQFISHNGNSICYIEI